MKERRCVLAEKAPEKKVSGMLLLKGVVAGLVAIALVIGGVCCALPRQAMWLTKRASTIMSIRVRNRKASTSRRRT